MHSRLALFFRRPNFLLRYAVAALSVIIAALLYAAIDQWLEGYSPLIVFTVAVMISAWYGGLGPGIFATILGWIVGDYFWIEPLYTLQIVHLHEFVHTAVFVSVGIAISLMSRALERARANAVAANHAKDHFLAVLSHELRNPLAPVMAAVCDLEQNAGLSEPAREDLAVIRRNIDLQTRLIDDLLDVNRLSRDKLPLRFQTCDAHEILRHALEVCQGEAVGKGLAVRFCPAAQRRHLRADPARLQQIFWNLLRNAIKFTSPGGTITVRTADTPSGLHIEVQDTGQGIPIHDLDRIFEPFEQGSIDTPRRFGGLGLGLALSKSLVTLHGGVIRATSPGPHQGATFSVVLPTIPVPAPIDAPQQMPETAPATARHILLVEDDPDAGPLLLRLLQRSGYDVTLATDLDHALRESSQNHFDLVISDLRLPDGSGIDLLRQIRARRQNVRGICLSGLGSDIDLQETKDAGFERHLVKPVDLAALRHAIEKPA